MITKPWPGIMRGVYGEPERFKQTYFSQFPGMYFTGDGARKDKNSYYWLMGRVDDVINVSGHRLGTAEIESALVSHKDVAEAAIVGYPHAPTLEGQYLIKDIMLFSAALVIGGTIRFEKDPRVYH